MSDGWTPERRARQAAAIRNWQPWSRSTGPKTAKGKAAVARNAFKGGHRPALRAMMREWREELRWHDELTDDLARQTPQL